MVFSSVVFLSVFLPVFLLVYYAVPKTLKNYFLLFASILFYAWGAPKFIFILSASIVVDFYLVKLIYQSSNPSIRKFLLVISIILSIVILLYFKYANFFVDNINTVFRSLGMDQFHWVNIALPVGISFFTFQKITYSLDIYRKVTKPTATVADYLLYVLMFPQLIAGPIVRYNTVAKEIQNRNASYPDRINGFVRFSIGLAKKVILANTLGETADVIFNSELNTIGTSQAWLGLLAYSFQIYFDFAGYSDMAIGLGRMIGFTFPENFNSPYLSGNITEFWRRWHMTLGHWMRDYLYIPLGGNRVKSQKRLFINLWIVFLISGFWHGASWNFVIWGAYHGIFLVLDRIFLIKFLSIFWRPVSVIVTFIISILGWVFFRLETFNEAILFFRRLFLFEPTENSINLSWGVLLMISSAMLFSWITAFRIGKNLEILFFRGYKSKMQLWILLVVALFLCFLSMALIVGGDYNPFIYFRF